ncbi:NADH:ubiquinone oxidoreductase, chain E [Acetoanaerobium sticklandii]|uniref:NADH:ubiquinone oxidoreductase, chain E n=1 Tax=Acetoanaerobium sticklandii (strain ATCC 12662 / DSM 519 / JCM 1433 / CCUG 9281 / NCIMB 10654 / HF) TaxID=499177 RepID=E3PUH5_ACESD|nr:NADH-quinone oxidoreductase subunit NuoE [Acetoanaerobium sticklandii]CBH22413.1 NADH:ubiquinone oxidoreductase, chain E [Acetoanaerobium sticklandii]
MACNCSNKVEEVRELVDLSLIDPIIEKYGKIKGATITILQGVQEEYGYIPSESLTYIAQKTGMKEAKLYGVATFYTQFRMNPVGKNLILLCQGTACHVNGASTIEKAICEELGITEGETTLDKIFTFTNVACLGCCSLAPVMMINGETYAKLTPEKTVEVLRNLRKEAQSEMEGK